MLAERRTVGKESLSHGFADYRHLPRLVCILWSKAAPLHQWNSHGRKEILAHNIISDGPFLSVRRSYFACERQSRPGTLMKSVESKRRRLHARYRAHLVFNFTHQGRQSWIVGFVSGRRRIDHKQHHVLFIEARGNTL